MDFHLGDQRGPEGVQSQPTPPRTNPHDPTLDSTNRIIKACVVCADVFRRPPTRVAPGRLAESKPSLMRVTSGRRRNARRDDGCGSRRMGRCATIALAKINTDTHIILHHTHTASLGPVGGGEANGFFREGCRCTTCCEWSAGRLKNAETRLDGLDSSEGLGAPLSVGPTARSLRCMLPGETSAMSAAIRRGRSVRVNSLRRSSSISRDLPIVPASLGRSGRLDCLGEREPSPREEKAAELCRYSDVPEMIEGPLAASPKKPEMRPSGRGSDPCSDQVPSGVNRGPTGPSGLDTARCKGET